MSNWEPVPLPDPKAFKSLFAAELDTPPQYQAHSPDRVGSVSHWASHVDAVNIVFKAIEAGDSSSGEMNWALIHLCRHSIETLCKALIWSFWDNDASKLSELEANRPSDIGQLEKLTEGPKGHNLRTLGWYAGRAIDCIFAGEEDPSGSVGWPMIQKRLDMWQRADPLGDVFRYGRNSKLSPYKIDENISCLKALQLFEEITKWVALADELHAAMRAEVD